MSKVFMRKPGFALTTQPMNKAMVLNRRKKSTYTEAL